MLKFRLAFYVAALAFAVLVNVGFDTARISTWLSDSGVTAEQLSEMAQTISTIN